MKHIQEIRLDRQKSKSKQQRFKHLNWLSTEKLLHAGEEACDTSLGAKASPQLGRLSLHYSIDDVYKRI